MKALAGVAAVAFVVLVGAFVFMPDGVTPKDQEQSESEVKQAIMDRWDAYMANAADMDLDTWLSYWTTDVRLLEPGMDMTGDELPAWGEEFFASGGQVFSLDLESFEIFVHGDVAYQIGQYDEVFQLPNEDRSEAHNYFFARWENEGGTWKISRFLAGPRDAPSEG